MAEHQSWGWIFHGKNQCLTLYSLLQPSLLIDDKIRMLFRKISGLTSQDIWSCDMDFSESLWNSQVMGMNIQWVSYTHGPNPHALIHVRQFSPVSLMTRQREEKSKIALGKFCRNYNLVWGDILMRTPWKYSCKTLQSLRICKLRPRFYLKSFSPSWQCKRF